MDYNGGEADVCVSNIYRSNGREQVLNCNQTVSLDLTGCQYLSDIHQRIKEAFGFPDYYGENWDAFYDMLCTENTAERIVITGVGKIPWHLSEALMQMYETIQDAQRHLLKFQKVLTWEATD